MPQKILNPRDPSSLLPNLPPGAEVLVIRLRSIGDVVLTLPALAALHAWRPDLRIRFLVEPLCVPLVEGIPAVNEVLVHRSFWASVRDLRRRRFTIAFNMHGGPTSAMLTALSGAPLRVCWRGLRFSFVYNVLAPPAVPPDGRSRVHTVEHRLYQFLWTGLPAGPIPPPALQARPDAVAFVRQKLAEKGIAPGERYAVLRPGAMLASKRWPVEHFAQVARWLREAQGLAVVVNLGPGDEAIAAEIERHLAPLSVVISSLDLRQLTALLASARLFVGNDTGPTHMAAAAGVPCVAIFGASDSEVWHPWMTEHRVVQNCFPCDRCPVGRCPSFRESRCILTVTVDQVRRACEELLASRANRVRANASTQSPSDD
jgi:lipopolysaccharide heptosyltransferase II